MSLNTPASCGSCGMHECQFNIEKEFSRINSEHSAWLLDKPSLEFSAYLSYMIAGDDLVFLPLRRKPLNNNLRDWHIPNTCALIQSPITMLRRSIALRLSVRYGSGRRQHIIEDFDQRIAAIYATKLPFTVKKLIVWQNFLPFLQLDKTLGGRKYDVLLWRAPRHVLQPMLDQAKALYPESTTLQDFRSHARIVEAERIALENAEKIITPHPKLAQLYADKSLLLPWVWPSEASQERGNRIAFLGPTLGRKGAYVVREAVRKLGLPIIVIGKNLEQENFWQGISIEQRNIGPGCFDSVGLLLAPALAEYNPSSLMNALMQNITVLATGWCGLGPVNNLHFVDPFDASALAEKILSLLPDDS